MKVQVLSGAPKYKNPNFALIGDEFGFLIYISKRGGIVIDTAPFVICCFSSLFIFTFVLFQPLGEILRLRKPFFSRIRVLPFFFPAFSGLMEPIIVSAVPVFYGGGCKLATGMILLFKLTAHQMVTDIEGRDLSRRPRQRFVIVLQSWLNKKIAFSGELPQIVFVL